MLNMYINGSFPEGRFRQTLYEGNIWLNTKLETAQRLCELADRHAVSILGESPRRAHLRMTVDEFIRAVSKLKTGFTNSSEVKSIVREFTEEIGQNPNEYYFDVPRLRVVPNFSYLNSGVSYAYKPHRDLWYGAPTCQLNTWMTVYPIEPSQTMMINPAYFDRAVPNTSDTWDLKDWIENQRHSAAMNVANEERPHPLPLEAIDSTGEIRLAGERAEMIIFSGAHLHGTVPNLGDLIRFSVDFRLFHNDDLRTGVGAANLDGAATNIEYGFSDYLSVSDFSPFQMLNR